LLLHQPSQLLERNGERLAAALEAIKASGKTRKIGVSIYNPAQLGELLPRLKCDLVQAPLNIMNRCLIETGWCARLKEAGIEVHARSVFLQGLLLMTKRPNKFNRWNAIWEEWDFWLQQTGLTPLEACLRYALSCDGIDRFVVGVDSAGQLREILAASVGDAPSAPPWRSPVPAGLIDPSCWENL
jgi:aryl-alcohol dehydrogenase-like predicted oxidoreductase